MINKLFIKQVKGQPPVPVKSITLIEGGGIEGDIHRADAERAVCIITESTENEIAAYGEKYNCMQKFSCNAVISGNRKFRKGDTLTVNGAVLTVNAVGRECHRLCDIPACPLIDGVIFASVSIGGTIHIGDVEEYA